MGNSKVLKVNASHTGYRKYVTLLLFVLAMHSCSKSDDVELVAYTGHVLVYDGPEIGEYDALNASYLKPFANVQVFISSCKPWAGWLGGGCTPAGRIEEMDVTDAEGKFSISFRAHNELSYYPEIEYRSDYVDKSEGYSPEPYKDIILVPRSLIK